MDSIASPAQKFAAASARKKYQITAEFIETFDFPFDPFRLQHAMLSKMGKVFSLLLLREQVRQ
jgi:hypothetical protein